MALSRTKTAPVGESIPVASGGSEVVHAIHAPATQPPISIDQIATGIPALNSPGNMSAPNETMFATSTIDATSPASASLAASRPTAFNRDHAISAPPIRCSAPRISSLLARCRLLCICCRCRRAGDSNPPSVSITAALQ
jgi:hypothetical protein